MKFKYSIVYLFLPLLSIFMSCDADVDVNFLINGQDLTPGEEQPADVTNIESILTVFSGDSIIFTDVSSPEKNIDQRIWKVNGTNEIGGGAQGKKHFSSVFDTEGIYRIKLCINKEENCVSKWLKVESWGPPISTNPVVTFNSPPDLYNTVTEDFIDIQVSTENIFSKDELTLLIKEVKRGFEFDEVTGMLTKKVKLGIGENKIEVLASGGDDLVSEWVMVNYDPKSKGKSKPGDLDISTATPAPTKTSAKPYIKINTPSRNFNTLEPSVALSFKTGNIGPKENIVVEVNGNAFNNYQYNQGKRSYEGNLSLAEGMNTIVVKTKDGLAMDVSNVKVLKRAANPPAPVVASQGPMVKIVTPRGTQSKKGKVEVTLKTKHLTGPRDLTVLLNGTKISGLRFAADRQLWVGQVNLKNGKNIIEAQVKNGNGSSKDQLAIDYEGRKKSLSTLNTIGLSAGAYSSACSNANVSNYSFSMTPQADIELLEFVVFSNICGGLEINMQSTTGTEKTKVELIKGKNQITLSDINARLASGTRYSFSLKTIAGYGLCNASATPQLEDAAGCAIQAISKPQVKMDAQGKSIIYDLKYLY